MNRRLITLAAASAAAVVLAGCGTTEPAATSSASADAKGITLTDANGTEVKLDGPAKKVVGTEWDVVEHLVSLGVQPVGVADVKGYTAWDASAPLTGSPKDIGTRGEPSMDTVASLSPDLIVANTDLPAAAIKQLREIAPVLTIDSADSADQIARMEGNLDLIAEATGTTDKAKELKTAFEAKVAEGKKALTDAGLAGREIAFADGYVVSNQVSIRPYTGGSLIGNVNTALGLKNAWTLEGDKDYGLGATDVEGLSKLGDVEFAYIGNKSEGTDPFKDDLAKNSVWKGLPFVKKGNVHQLADGIWMFGGPKSMEAYIDAVVGALTK
ncbi:ABC transporter substrate-binding protein [Streptomyces antibioticus]|uniref:ABC transporter substrate-binding protein n=1 Tax=Streptomyces antibioticus TaxID=1890 RepID=A0AAE7CNU2_STRAT|nr:iron-siderophore ABC transporter substrate-binding protein [Streptomyces antibioticus]MCX4741449.1 iron-siderophore ABC transporter substrate-binding protein [Streptomyces antibioticus]OOQ47801.1 ABC transporter substrate-binding protein [Streptomyces antibioticus]QIT48126.1 iron-siderophore ABC transporter substrate-binding protein [Streptomyces antibioticus]